MLSMDPNEKKKKTWLNMRPNFLFPFCLASQLVLVIDSVATADSTNIWNPENQLCMGEDNQDADVVK